MNISNLYPGLILKNYKELCTLLEEPVKTGKSKELQLIDFSRYFNYTKQGHKIIINEIFNNPLEKIDHRKDLDKEGNNSKYVDDVKILLLNRLLQCEDYTYTLTKNNLFEFLGMVNKLYLEKDIAKSIIFKNDSRVTDFDINHFYFRTNNKLTKILFDSLNSLKRKYLIKYREVNIIVRLDEKGKEIHTEANKEEELILLDAKYTALSDMGLNSIMQVVLKFKTEEYYTKVNRKLNENNIKYAYKQFEIIFNKDNIIRELSSPELIKHRKELNDKILEIINQNAKKTYDKNLEEYDIKLDAFINDENIIGQRTNTFFEMFRHKEDYLDIQMELADYLIKLN